MLLQNMLQQELISMTFNQRSNGLLDLCPDVDDTSLNRGTFHRTSLCKKMTTICDKCGLDPALVTELRKRIDSLKEEIILLQDQLKIMEQEQASQRLEIRDLSQQLNNRIEGCNNITTMMAPPPPPPPPPPPLIPSSFSVIESIKKNRKLQKSKSFNGHSKESFIDMAIVLKDMKNVKLKQIARSPGGTPIRIKPEPLDLDAGSFLARALKRKFDSISAALCQSPTISPIKDMVSPLRKKECVPGPHILHKSKRNINTNITVPKNLPVLVE